MSNNTDHRTDDQIAYVDKSHDFLCQTGGVLGMPMPEYRYAVPERVREMAEALMVVVNSLDTNPDNPFSGSSMHEQLKKALGHALWESRR